MRHLFQLAAALLALSTVWPASATAGYCVWRNSNSASSPGVVRLGHVIGLTDAGASGLGRSIDPVGYGYGGPRAYGRNGNSITIAQSAGAQRDTLNARIDEIYRDLAAALGPRKAAGLEAERTAWEKSSRARCNAAVPYYQGTGWRLSYTRCKNREAMAHIEELEVRLRKLRR